MSQVTTKTAAAAPDPDGLRARTGLPPHALLWELATITAVSRCLHVVAELGVADALEPAGAEIDVLAERVGVDVDALGRVLQALAANGVFDVELPAVRHSEASLLLRGDHPMSMGPFVHMMGLPMCWDALTLLGGTVRTGCAGIYALDSDGLFPYLRRHPDQRAVFDQAMTAKSHADIHCVLEAYDFGAHRSVADIGGGQGHLLRAISHRHHGVEPTLVELPEVIARVEQQRPADDRVQLVAAEFFTDDLPAADVYVLMEILHDWDDADAVRILSNLRRGAPDDAVVLLVEVVLADRRGPDPATTLDIIMLTVTGGRQRTAAQYSRVFEAAGLELVRVIPTAGAVQIVEARVRPVDSRQLPGQPEGTRS
jgi:hypothetical protein